MGFLFVLFLLQELTNILGVFSYKLSAAFAHVHLLKFFPVGRIQEIEMNNIPALNGCELSFKPPDHLLDLGIRFLPILFFFPFGGTITKTQPHGSPDDRPADRSPAGNPAAERGGHFNGLGFIKI